LLDSIGNPNRNVFLAGGIDGLLTNRKVNLDGFVLAASKTVDRSNYRDYYAYNPDGDIFSQWGGTTKLLGSEVNYYRVEGTAKAFVTDSFMTIRSPDDTLELLSGPRFNPAIPVIQGAPPVRDHIAVTPRAVRLTASGDHP